MNNVVSIEKPATETKPARFKITCELEGFHIEVETEGKADNLKAMIERLKAIGAQPLTGKPGQAQSNSTSTPLCPVHNKPMKSSRKPGTFYCSKQIGEGVYCDQKA
jgi:hypothetical protein